MLNKITMNYKSLIQTEQKSSNFNLFNFTLFAFVHPTNSFQIQISDFVALSYFNSRNLQIQIHETLIPEE